MHPENEMKVDELKELLDSKHLKIDVLKLLDHIPVIGQVWDSIF